MVANLQKKKKKKKIFKKPCLKIEIFCYENWETYGIVKCTMIVLLLMCVFALSTHISVVLNVIH